MSRELYWMPVVEQEPQWTDAKYVLLDVFTDGEERDFRLTRDDLHTLNVMIKMTGDLDTGQALAKLVEAIQKYGAIDLSLR